ncbi:MAG TPA: phosphatase PAP2 family protein [Roseiflexaceae bacterium]|nr:phosphatase PAP2 family protein [Roseiflexaceae bacterium]
MAPHSNIPHEAYEAGSLDGRGYALARWLSQIFHPILLNIMSFVIVGYAALNTPLSGLKWAAISVLVLIVPPTIFYTIRLRQGALADEDVSIREQRNELYLFGFIWALLALPLLGYIGAPRPFLAMTICALLLGMVNGGINLFWKISAHATSIAGTAMIALLYAPALGAILWFCAVLVGWARVRTRNHTPLQVLAGFCSAVGVILVVFQFFGTRG